MNRASRRKPRVRITLTGLGWLVAGSLPGNTEASK